MAPPWEVALLAGILLGLLLFAGVVGGRRERFGAAGLALAWLALAAVERHAPLALLLPLRAGLDAALLMAFCRLSWKSARSWPAWAALLQGVAIAVHLAYMLRGGSDVRIDLDALALIRGAQALVLAVGVVRHGRGAGPLAVTE